MVYLYICISVYLYICISVYLYICIIICISVYICTFILSKCLSEFPSRVDWILIEIKSIVRTNMPPNLCLVRVRMRRWIGWLVINSLHTHVNTNQYQIQFYFHFPHDFLSSHKPTLSSLSTAEEIVRNFSEGTPQTSNIPSSIFLWFTWKKENVK